MAELRLTAALIVAAAAVASADTTPMVKAPAGWRADAERAASLAQTVHGAAEVWGPAGDTSVALVVTRAPAPDPRAAIADVHAEVERAKITSKKVVEDRWEDGPAAANLAWHDDDAGMVYRTRVVALNGVAVVGACIARADAPAPLMNACEAALATVDPGAGTVETPALPEPAVKPSKTSSTMSEPNPQIRLPPTPIEQDGGGGGGTTDRRPMYVGAGLIVLAVVFWWNRSRREKFEREDAGKTTDADADDLHDAARSNKDSEND